MIFHIPLIISVQLGREAPSEANWPHPIVDSAANSVELKQTHQNSFAHISPVVVEAVAAAASKRYRIGSVVVELVVVVEKGGKVKQRFGSGQVKKRKRFVNFEVAACCDCGCDDGFIIEFGEGRGLGEDAAAAFSAMDWIGLDWNKNYGACKVKRKGERKEEKRITQVYPDKQRE
ncbi:unnamed protein product [Dovyalis caffra]|uniref:Uncharacterized protein n=1 Tax=Dovyalis caffra TaxID=77055 RepID=A0AAV1SVB9_9ROSI|nr:unnamed protein product [Dovyalis caffra]